eukprot:COSAG03_NODE_1064_length_4925_cov_1382.405097_7_plen_184_part_00
MPLPPPPRPRGRRATAPPSSPTRAARCGAGPAELPTPPRLTQKAKDRRPPIFDRSPRRKFNRCDLLDFRVRWVKSEGGGENLLVNSHCAKSWQGRPRGARARAAKRLPAMLRCNCTRGHAWTRGVHCTRHVDTRYADVAVSHVLASHGRTRAVDHRLCGLARTSASDRRAGSTRRLRSCDSTT